MSPPPHSQDPDKTELKEAAIEHCEEVTPVVVDDSYGPGSADEKPFVGIRRLLKRNPSMEFRREVAQMNQEALDPVEVKHVSDPTLSSGANI